MREEARADLAAVLGEALRLLPPAWMLYRKGGDVYTGPHPEIRPEGDVAPFLQAVSAGLLLTSSYGETLHGVGARVMYGASMLYVLAAVPAWKPGGGSPRPVWHASGFLVLASVQVVLGIAHIPAVQLPLGVLMFGLSVLALARR
ncbi:hypothetical protein [Kitasatospora sp. NPDC088548]|uniref:hypothetical protein n=1 Tax=Kitasatospora sp. NPDC088548 TaxID=3364075 RepID=UPI0038235338